MGKPAVRPLSRQTQETLALLGKLIHATRLERGISMEDLAARAGVSRWSVHRVERGDASCAVGTVFELATLLGIPLFEADPSRLAAQRAAIEHRLMLLPKTAKTGETRVDDDF